MKRKLIVLITILAIISVGSICLQAIHNNGSIVKSSYALLPNSINKNNVHFSITTDQDRYSRSINTIELLIENFGTSGIEFGEFYTIERYLNGTWYTIDFDDNIAFNSIGYFLDSQQNRKLDINMKILDYKMKSGTYRVIKDFTVDGKIITLAAEFKLE